jgi:hypothetical protein
VSLYRRATVGALMIAPLLLLADNLLHPREFRTGEGNEARQLAEIAAHGERWQLAHVLGFFAILMYVAAVLGLAYLVRRSSPRLGLWGGVLGTAGLVGLAGVIAIDGFTWGVLGQVYHRPAVDRHTLEVALKEVQGSSWSLPFYVLPAAWIAGMLVLAAGLARGTAVPAWSAALLGLAAVIAGTETLITSNAYFIAGAAALLVAGVALAVPIARMPEAEFGPSRLSNSATAAPIAAPATTSDG